MRIELNSRQRKILRILGLERSLSAKQILESINSTQLDVSRPTINRDLDEMVDAGILERSGAGPATVYSLSASAKMLTYFDPEEYFTDEADDREVLETFNWNIFETLDPDNLFTAEEEVYLEELDEEFRTHKAKLSETILQKEIERVTIELSWKSSAIEGNTYSLLETENLIRNGIAARGKTSEETQMILNHKSAIDFIFSHHDEFQQLSVAKIEHVHSLLIENLNVSKGLRKTLVGITGTKYRPLDNEHQIRDALQKTVELVNSTDSQFKKSLLALILLSYTQAFEDGNKRTSRLICNALLLAANSFPLSFRSVDEVRYKQGLLLFYEQNNIGLFKQIFIEQAEFAVRNYFQASNS